jgi:SecD/SecF fusion protein
MVYGQVFENSIWQTMRRSIGTSVSTLLVVIAMYAFGTGVIKLFAFTVGIGVLAGTVSSIFLAAPLAYLMLGKFASEQKKL